MQILYKNIIEEAIKKVESQIKQLPDGKNLLLFSGYLDKIYYNLLFDNKIKDKELVFTNYFIKFYSEIPKGQMAFNLAEIVGVFWISNLLYEKKIITNEKFRVDNSILKPVLETAIKMQENNLYDLFSASVGNVNAVLSIAKELDKEQEKLLIEYLKILEKTAEQEEHCDGYKWQSYNFLTKEYTYNLGLSHGITSIVALLCKILEKCSFNQEIKEHSEKIMRKAINYILYNEIDFEKYNSHFPNHSIDYYNDKLYGSRLAWCYGDLGIAYTLLRAALVLDDKILLNKSTSILLDCTKRIDYAKNYIFDPWFCHGTSGIAYIFKKTFEKTNITEFNVSANFWLSETINILKTNIIDYIHNKHPDHKKDDLINKLAHKLKSTNMIEGYTGIAMVLRSFLNTDNCEWEEFFLLN